MPRKPIPIDRPPVRDADKLRGKTVKDLNEAERDRMADELTANKRDPSSRNLIDRRLLPTRNDYVDDHDRGTVEADDRVRNYSYHKVAFPDGTTITERNFTQRTLRAAITGQNLTFIRCNLVNNVIDPSWTLEQCNDNQVDFDAIEAAEAAERGLR